MEENLKTDPISPEPPLRGPVLVPEGGPADAGHFPGQAPHDLFRLARQIETWGAGAVGSATTRPGAARNVEEERRPFIEHLEELRRRLLRSVLWLALGTGIGFRFSGEILSGLIRPVGQVVFLNPVEPFLVHLQIALIAGVVVSFPLWVWEGWGFLKPALRPRERRFIFGLVPFSVGLFLTGCWFGWKVLLPIALKFLLAFGSGPLTPMLTVGPTIGFIGWMTIACGLLFQIPIVILGLVQLNWVRPMTLLRQWRLAVLSILGLAAILTPTPDVATQMLLAIPMAILYIGSVGLARLIPQRDTLRGSDPLGSDPFRTT